MTEFAENIYCTATISYNANSPGPQINREGIHSRNASMKIGVRNKEGDYREVNRIIDENGLVSIKITERFANGRPDNEINPTHWYDRMKIAGDGKTEKEAVYSTDEDSTKTRGYERYSKDTR